MARGTPRLSPEGRIRPTPKQVAETGQTSHVPKAPVSPPLLRGGRLSPALGAGSAGHQGRSVQGL